LDTEEKENNLLKNYSPKVELWKSREIESGTRQTIYTLKLPAIFKKTEAWADSGLSVTEASYWAFVLQVSVIMVPTPVLRYAVDNFGREITCEIPPNLSKGYLITVDDLMTATRKYNDEPANG
jgi:hypothetical protein